MFDPCAVVPVFDHERAVAAVVDGLRTVGLACILVDDGSGPACSRVLLERMAEGPLPRVLDIGLTPDGAWRIEFDESTVPEAS